MLFNSFVSLGLLLKSAEVEEMLFKVFLCLVICLWGFAFGIAFEGIVNDKLNFRDGVVITVFTLAALFATYNLVIA